MVRPENMPSQDPALGSFKDDILEGGHEELLDNTERGCGHLQHNACYVRSDVQLLSSVDGEVPRFVTLDEPVEYREYSGRGAIIPNWVTFPGVPFGIGYMNEGYTTTPEEEIHRHHERLQESIYFDGDHYGEITPARAQDIIMSVGASHWPEPEDYISECRQQGLNLKISSGPNAEPPVIDPMLTRCWVVHPNGAGQGRAAIIGYAVLSRAVYTTGETATEDDPDIPTYAEEWYETGKVDLATPGEEAEQQDDSAADLDEFADN